jgi:hypothetical protein
MIISELAMMELNSYQYEFYILELQTTIFNTTRKFMYDKSYFLIKKYCLNKSHLPTLTTI